MKTRIITLLLLLPVIFLKAQTPPNLKGANAYYDAIMLAELKQDYTNKVASPALQATLSKFYQDPLTDTLSKAELAQIRIAYAQAGITQNSLPFVGGLSIPSAWQSLLIDAASEIIAEEFKEGLTNRYLNKFRERLDSIPALKALLPKTSQFLQQADPFNYASISKEFKEVFKEDLRAAPNQLVTFLDTTSIAPYASFRTSRYYQPLRISTDIGDKLLNGYNPAQLLEYLDLRYKEPANAWYPYFHTLNILQLNLQNLEDKPTSFDGAAASYQNLWLGMDKLRKLDSPEKILYFFSVIRTYNPEIYTTLHIDVQSASNYFRQGIIPLLSVTTKFDNILSKKELTADDYNQMIQLTIDLLSIAKVFDTRNVINEDFLLIARKVTDMHKTILKKDYSMVLPGILYIAEKCSPAGDTSVPLVGFRNAILKYSPFMVGVVSAESKEDMKEVLKKAILPSGNYLVKRNSQFSFNLSAHPGIVAGYERLPNTNTGSSRKWNYQPNIGITAPIGFDLVWGARGNYQADKHSYVKDKALKSLKGWYKGIFLSFADLGAVVNYRLNSKEELPEEITFKQIFSPGAALHIGFSNTPLTLGLGAQYTPGLREVTEQNIRKETSSLRWQLRLSWDLPLVNIATTQR